MKKYVVSTDWGDINVKVLGTSMAQLRSEVTATDDIRPQVDAIESMILAHAAAGIEVDEPEYVDGVNTALNALDDA